MMDVTELKELVGDGKIFSASFVKRSDGSVRQMLARTGVKPDGGGERSYNPSDHNLLLVWDLQAKGYRTIPADNLIRIKAHGREVQTELAKRYPPR
jgi:hypothetical protein